ncbi:hydrolase, TatD family protein [Pelomyxa schiedti]|nr:hydrolase, TatD family protein [Pelomyxa schiedti]
MTEGAHTAPVDLDPHPQQQPNEPDQQPSSPSPSPSSPSSAPTPATKKSASAATRKQPPASASSSAATAKTKKGGGGGGAPQQNNKGKKAATKAAPVVVEDPGDQPYCDAHVHIDSVLEELCAAELGKAVNAKAEAATTATDAATTTATAAIPSGDATASAPTKPRLVLRDVKASLFPTMRFAVNVCCSPEDIDQYSATQDAHDWIYSTYGIHPHDASHYDDVVEQRLIARMSHPRTVGWGECGLDFFRNLSPPAIQLEVFPKQMKRAIEFNKTLVVHTRDADDDTLRLMTETLPANHPIHLHCYTGGPEFASEMLRRFPNLVVGFTGVATFKSSDKIREAVKIVPLERLLLETDGPYMAPVPFRGKTAHPGHIPVVASEIGRLKGVTQKEALQITMNNTMRIYSIHL